MSARRTGGTRATVCLQRAGTSCRLHSYRVDFDAVADYGQAVAEQLGIDPARLFKTLVVFADGRPMVGLVSADARLSVKELAKVTGVRRVRMASPPRGWWTSPRSRRGGAPHRIGTRRHQSIRAAPKNDGGSGPVSLALHDHMGERRKTRIADRSRSRRVGRSPEGKHSFYFNSIVGPFWISALTETAFPYSQRIECRSRKAQERSRKGKG